MTPDNDGNALTLEDAVNQLSEIAEKSDSDTGRPDGDEEAETDTEADEASEASAEENAEAESEDAEQGKAKTDKSESEGEEVDIENVELTLKDGTKTTVKELAKSYYREADYTRDKQRVLEKERALEASAGEKSKRLDSLIEAMETLLGQEPDADVDPIGYADWVKRGKLIEASKKERETKAKELEGKQLQAFSEARTKALEELKSGRIFADWKDEDSLGKGLAGLQAYAISSGYTPDELKRLFDVRLYRDIEKARRWDEAQQATAKMVKAVGVKPKQQLKAGAKGNQQSLKEKSTEAAQRRFAQTRKSADAVEYLTRLAS